MFHVKHSISYMPNMLDLFSSIHKLYSEHKAALEIYTDKLLWWNQKVNLVSRDVSRETLMEHIKHSITLSEIGGVKRAANILDTGTGGGLPGLPLAIVNPSKNFLLNDIVQKKINVVNQIKREQGLINVSTQACSISELKVSDFDVVISKHAFKINDLIAHFGAESWKEIILLKGKSFEEELEGLSISLDIQVVDLFELSQNPFYNGKAILSIKKKEASEE